MDDEQTLAFTMENPKRPISNQETSVDDDDDSSSKTKRRKAKLCYMKMETYEGS